MSWAGVPLGVGTRVMFDGEIHQITEWLPGMAGAEVVLTGSTSACRMSLVALFEGGRVKVIPDRPGPEPDDEDDPPAVALLGLSAHEIQQVRELAAHIRELLTGFRSGSSQIALPGEPRPQYDPSLSLTKKYAAKVRELGIARRTLRRHVSLYRKCGEAGLASARSHARSRVDPRWVEAAEQIMVEHTYESKPSRAAVISKLRSGWSGCSGLTPSMNRPGLPLIANCSDLKDSTGFLGARQSALSKTFGFRTSGLNL